MARLAGSAKLLRAINSSATLSHLLTLGRLTRAELRELTGLSKPTSSEMLRLLADAGLAVVVGRTAGGPGPTAEIYAPNADAAYVVALSVRDTTGEDRPDLAVGVCDLTGSIRHRAEHTVGFADSSPDEIVATAVHDACAAAAIDPARVRHIRIGVPGSYDQRSDTIHHIDVPGWNEPGTLGKIRARLNAPTAVENDVNLAAFAERHRGVAAGVDGFAMLWLDHGLGLAIDLDGSLLQGAHGGAGEIGYLPIYPRRPGGPIDLQDLVGGPAVTALAEEHGVRRRTPGEAVAAAPPALIEQLAQRIGFALATVVAVLDPPLVVLAGEVARSGGARLRDAVAAATNPATPHVEIAVTAVDDDAVLLGGLDAGLQALRESLISSLAQPSLD